MITISDVLLYLICIQNQSSISFVERMLIFILFLRSSVSFSTFLQKVFRRSLKMITGQFPGKYSQANGRLRENFEKKIQGEN